MKYFVAIVVFLGVSCSASSASAANLRVAPPIESVVASRMAVPVLVDTNGVSINVVSASIHFDPSQLSFDGYENNGVIFQWFPVPHEEGSGVVSFSGIIPGGVERLYDPEHPLNRAFTVVTLYFRSTHQGSAVITPESVELLQNDGTGAHLPVTTTAATVRIKEGSAKNTLENSDTTKPDPFTIVVIDHSVFGRTPRLATFTTTDVGSGIAYYEVQVGSLPYVRATSPYALPYRLFSFGLTVRAVDFAGNSTEETILVPGERPYAIGVVGAGMLLIVLFYRYRIYRKKTSP